MAATNFTPIILYHSTTPSATPTAGNLNSGELAINITDGKLFYKDNGGVVQTLASSSTATIGGSNTQVQYNSGGSLAGSANLTFDGTTLSLAGINNTGNTTLGDASADSLVINATIGSNLIFTDNTYDIGASGATRPRNLYLSNNLVVGGAQTLTGALTVDSTTDSTSTTTGSIQTDGGVGIAKSLYVGGPSVISVNSSSDALRITQIGTGNALVVEDSANPDATPFVVDAGGNVIIGTSNPSSTAYSLYVESASGVLTSTGSNTAATSPTIGTSRRRTGLASVVSGDSLGKFSGFGWDATSFVEATRIESAVDGTPGTNDMPGRLVFSTTADGASSPTERMRIDSAGQVGIGGAASSGQTIRIAKNMTGSTTSSAVFNLGQIQSDVTSSGHYFRTQAATSAAAFTTNVSHYTAVQGTFGAGSTVTNQYGFNVESSLTGATNNYGFFSNIASGTGRWNFYAAGTADNYFAGKVGIGTTPLVNYLLTFGGSLTGSTNMASTSTIVTIASDVTNSYRGYYSSVSTAAASFTLFNLAHFRADQGTIGAGSTVTNQYGVYVAPTLIGATNNYGFYSDIASGTGRWNFYAGGSADNYFAGNVGIGTASPTSKLQVANSTAVDTYIRTSNSVATSGFDFGLSSGGDGYVYNRNNTNLIFGTNSAERLRIASDGNVTFKNAITETVATLATSGTIALNPASGTIQTCAAAGTITFTDSLSSGQSISLRLTSGSSFTINWPTITWVTSAGNVAPTLTANDTLVFWKISTTLYGAYVGSGA